MGVKVTAKDGKNKFDRSSLETTEAPAPAVSEPRPQPKPPETKQS